MYSYPELYCFSNNMGNGHYFHSLYQFSCSPFHYWLKYKTLKIACIRHRSAVYHFLHNYTKQLNIYGYFFTQNISITCVLNANIFRFIFSGFGEKFKIQSYQLKYSCNLSDHIKVPVSKFLSSVTECPKRDHASKLHSTSQTDN